MSVEKVMRKDATFAHPKITHYGKKEERTGFGLQPDKKDCGYGEVGERNELHHGMDFIHERHIPVFQKHADRHALPDNRATDSLD